MAQNTKDVRVTGTKVKWIVDSKPAGVSLTDPKQIKPDIEAGYERAKKRVASLAISGIWPT